MVPVRVRKRNGHSWSTARSFAVLSPSTRWLSQRVCKIKLNPAIISSCEQTYKCTFGPVIFWDKISVASSKNVVTMCLAQRLMDISWSYGVRLTSDDDAETLFIGAALALVGDCRGVDVVGKCDVGLSIVDFQWLRSVPSPPSSDTMEMSAMIPLSDIGKKKNQISSDNGRR